MESIIKRFLTYTQFDTQSEENSSTTPSTEKQFRLAEFLKQELETLGCKNILLDDKCYLYAEIPATPGYENIPAIGFIAHLDTSDAVSGCNVKPSVIRNWDGSPLPLGNSGMILSPAEKYINKTLIVTDGTTLLGADDKAGIAVITEAAAALLAGDMPHGKICIGFTPDEEIGRGADFFDVERFGAKFAFTLDGEAPEIIEYENFNAAGADIVITGVSAHPGSAKGVMVNAQKLAMEFDGMLPAAEAPECTAQREGFYHLTHSSGTAAKAELHYILRDHDSNQLEKRKNMLFAAAGFLNKKYPAAAVTVNIREQYRNMAEVLEKYPFLLETAETAIRESGSLPGNNPIRGGTDGARLSFMGLPCPNLGNGGHNFHSEREYAVAEEMQQAVQIMLNIIRLFAEKK